MSDHQKRGNYDDANTPDSHHLPAQKNSDNSKDNESLASRIQKSASGLAKNAFLSSAPSGDAQLLSNGTGKAAPSSSSSALAAAEQYGQSVGPSSSSSRNQTIHDSAETFRSTPAAQTGGFNLPGLTEDEFQTTYGGELSETISDIDEGPGKGKGKSSASNPVPRSTESVSESISGLETQTPTLNPSDGSGVVSILTDQTFDPEFPPGANEPEEYLETNLSQLSPHLTPNEIQMIESFRRQLPPAPQSTRSEQNSKHPQLNSLSLVPDIGSFLDNFHATPAADPSTAHATSLRDEVLTSLPGAAEWISAEEKYHDEVWGYLQPTLEAAAREIEEKKDSPSASVEDGPAVRRLKMVFRHMHH
ncbi:uncharacterized protein BDV14DRAFT_165842 [Aspergillus stella-maris]|uniref:uncharacterized protein n=1 Tax=Aspergillus stella-maris TaxID=1810926 RepID=UPI003CCD2933